MCQLRLAFLFQATILATCKYTRAVCFFATEHKNNVNLACSELRSAGFSGQLMGNNNKVMLQTFYEESLLNF